MRLMETPVPIPNTMVKRMSADDTWLETTWESRWLPDFKKQRTLEATIEIHIRTCWTSKRKNPFWAHSSAG